MKKRGIGSDDAQRGEGSEIVKKTGRKSENEQKGKGSEIAKKGLERENTRTRGSGCEDVNERGIAKERDTKEEERLIMMYVYAYI